MSPSVQNVAAKKPSYMSGPVIRSPTHANDDKGVVCITVFIVIWLYFYCWVFNCEQCKTNCKYLPSLTVIALGFHKSFISSLIWNCTGALNSWPYCSLSQAHDNPWWLVDLSTKRTVTRVTIMTRVNCCGKQT